MMRSQILSYLLALCVGALGALWAVIFLLPVLAASSFFQQFQFIEDWNARTVVIQQTQTVIVPQEEAMVQSIQQVERNVVALRSGRGDRGSGFVYTSDGLVVTRAHIVPSGWRVFVTLPTGEDVVAQVLKRDFTHDLALLKVERTNLQPVQFGEKAEVPLGSAVFVVGKTYEKAAVATFVSRGVVQSMGGTSGTTTMRGRDAFDGAPVFSMSRTMVGLSTLGVDGNLEFLLLLPLLSFLGN